MNFFQIRTVKLEQLTQRQLLSCVISFKELHRIIRFTAREVDRVSSDIGHIPDVKNIPSERAYYQRLLNDQRTKKISSYILQGINDKVEGKENLRAFPTSLIIALPDIINYVNDENEVNNENYKEKILEIQEPLAYYDADNECISIPYAQCALVVDGQHRLAGIKSLYDAAKAQNIKVGKRAMKDEYPRLKYTDVIEQLEKVSFQCTLLLGFTLWEQGKIFADVNFNQKPVNRSLYYDIFGSFPDLERNELFIAHQLALHLNNSNDSVLRNRIKMLGSGEGLFSQAAFVEAILPFFRSKGMWSYLLPGIISGKEVKYEFIADMFRAFFKVVKEVFSDNWPTEEQKTSHAYKSIMLKTTGLNALINLLGLIYRDARNKGVQFEKIDFDQMIKIYRVYLIRVKGYEQDYFSQTGDFGGSGSKGIQKRLFDRLVDDMKINELNAKYVQSIV